MNDFQDILKLVMEADEASPKPLVRPNLKNVGSSMSGQNDPLEAIKTWVSAHAQEYNVLRREVYSAINLLKECYDKLPEYDQGTVGQSLPGGAVNKPTAPTPTMNDERTAKLAALKAAAASKIGAYKNPQQPTPPAAGGTA